MHSSQRSSDDDVDVLQHDLTIPLENTQYSVTPDRRRSCFASNMMKISIGFVLAGLIGFVLFDSMANDRIPDLTKRMLQWFEENPLKGMIVYVLSSIIGVLLFFPGTVLVLSSGFIFGHVYGFRIGAAVAIVVSIFGTSIGSILSFILGRYLFKDCLAPSLQKYRLLKVLDKAMDQHGFRIMVLLHMNPVIPFGVLNYTAGITSISGKDFYFAAVGTFPGLFVYSFLGASATNIQALERAGDDNIFTISFIAVGLISGFFLLWFMTNYAKNELEVLEAQYALVENGADGNVRPISAGVSTDEMDNLSEWEGARGRNNIEVVEQRSRDQHDGPAIV